MQAKVKLWNSKKGFGFLDNGSGPDVFVAKKALRGCSYLRAGTQVEFECHITPKGLVAKHVTLINRGSNRASGQQVKETWHGVMT